MLEPRSKLRFDSYDKYPDCVLLALEGRCLDRKSAKLFFTLNFSEEWVKMLAGRIKVGLRSAELRLDLSNADMPLKHRNFVSDIDETLHASRRVDVRSSEETANEETVGSSASVKSLPEATAKVEQKASKKGTSGRESSTEFRFKLHQISAKGPNNRPAWTFTTETGEPVLQGAIKNCWLGDIEVTELPYDVIAQVEVAQRDVFITAAEGIWPEHVSLNKIAIIKRLLARKFASDITPLISKASLEND